MSEISFCLLRMTHVVSLQAFSTICQQETLCELPFYEYCIPQLQLADLKWYV